MARRKRHISHPRPAHTRPARSRSAHPLLSAPALVLLPLTAVYAAITACEGKLERATERALEDGFGRVLRLVNRLIRLEGVLARLARRNARVRAKAEMLADPVSRGVVREHLGGLEALRRWEAKALEASVLEAPTDFSPEVPMVSSPDVAAPGMQNKTERPERPYRWGREEFRLPSLPQARIRARAARRRNVAKAPAGARRESRIAVWPCELMTRAERRGRGRGRASGFRTWREPEAEVMAGIRLEPVPVARARACTGSYPAY